jgi:LysR family transcriptional regulator, low CO2-responsive transcriptional regulator
MKNATFRQMRVFSEVARHLSFARAAEELHLTPPAVTMQIKELEGHVGMPLFERQGRKVSLTMVGEYMLVYARRMLSTLKDAEDAALQMKRLEIGTLNVGMVSTAEYFLPRLIAMFRREHPGVEVRLAMGNREQLVQMLTRNDVDIAVMGRPPKELAMRAEPFAAHPHVFVAAPEHPLASVGRIPVAALQGHAFVSREPGSGTRAAMGNFFEKRRFTPRIVMEMPSNETIKQIVMAGLAIGFLSLHVIGMELRTRGIALIDVEESPVMRGWNVVNTQSKMLSPAAESFRYFVLEQGEAFLAREFGAHAMPGVAP